MAASNATTAEQQQEISAVVEPVATTTAKTALPATKAIGTAGVLTDEHGPYKIIRARKPDGTIVRAKQRISSTADDATHSTPAPVAKSSAQASTTKPSEVNQIANITKSSSKDANPSPAVPAAGSASQPITKDASKIAPANVSSSASAAKSGNAKVRSRVLHRFTGNVLTQTAAALFPDLNLQDLEDGDVPIDSDDDSDDDDYSTDEDDERTNRQNQGSGPGNLEKQSGKTSAGNERAATGAGGVALANNLGKGTPQKFATTSLEKDKLVKPVEQNKKTPIYTPEKSVKASETEINEKQINTDSDTTEKPQQTKEPRRVSKTSIIIRLIIWSILIGFPVLFIVLGILTATVNGGMAPASGKGEENDLQRAIKFAVSVWPIVFAAIVAQSLKTIATWRVERGIRLMTLEQLLGSHSVGAAIKQPFFLRRIDLISIGLLFLWSLSPIASQAMQRMLSTHAGTYQIEFDSYYVDTTGSNIGFMLKDQYFYQDIYILYTAAMLPQDRSHPKYDQFNNPIIPTMSSVAKSTQKNPDTNEWIDVPSYPNIQYSTIFGIPIEEFVGHNNTDEIGTQSLTISSSYFEVDCTAPTYLRLPDFYTLNLNFTVSASRTLALYGDDPSDAETKKLYFGSLKSSESKDCTMTNNFDTVNTCDNSTVTYSVCTFTRTFVNSDLSCNGTTAGMPCGVTKMQLAPNQTSIPNNKSAPDSMTNIAALLVGNDPLYQQGFPTLLERWISDPPTVLDPKNNSLIDLTQIAPKQFTQNLGLLVNTFWQVGFSPVHVSGRFNHSNTNENASAFAKTATASRTNTGDNFYAVNSIWLSVLFLCATILLVTGIATAIFEVLTVGPDVLGFASSIVRQSKHVRVPDSERGSSALSGPERARRLGKVRVMMQDVRGDRDIGRIALGTINKDSQRLRPGRLYR